MRSFKQNQKGNVSTIVAFSLLPLLAVLGGGIDAVRSATTTAELNAAVEGAVLAAANLNQTGSTTDVVNQYITANLAGTGISIDKLDIVVDSVETLNSRTVTVTASGGVETLFLGAVGFDTLPLFATASATENLTNVEIAMVLDVSSSMRGQRIKNLRSAATDFVNTILDGNNEDFTSINLIPFGGTVNIGDSMFEELSVPAFIEVEQEELSPFEQKKVDKGKKAQPVSFSTSTVNSDVSLDPDEDEYDIGEQVPEENFRFSDGDSCIELRDSDFNGGLIPLESRSQVPHFWEFLDFNPWCPGDRSAVIFNTNDGEALNDRIAELVLSDGTGMDIGAAWGLKTLTPDWQGRLGGDFPARPAPFFDEETLKVMIVMTDGGITSQNRPKDFSRFNVHTNRGITTTTPNEDAEVRNGNRGNRQIIENRGSANGTSTTNSTVGNFREVCEEARENGIIVYAIGFQINEGSFAENVLKPCASDPSKYFLVESLDISTAFEAIAASVSALRIVE